MGKKKKDVIRLERESVIPIIKHKLIQALVNLIEDTADHDEFLKFCRRVEYTIRAWYHLQFEDLMQLYSLFEPGFGGQRLEQHNLTAEEIDDLEQKFLTGLIKVMEKSNFKITSNEEIDIAANAQYRLNLPIVLDETKLDKKLLTTYFSKNPRENLPHFCDKFIVFRRGFGIDRMTAYFVQTKIDNIVARLWKCFLKITGIKWLLFGSKSKEVNKDKAEPVELKIDNKQEGLYVERVRIENMKLSIQNLLSQITIQEPTFERVIVVYRRIASKKDKLRNIYVKHFKNIPMADMEIVLPAKKNPGLTPKDWAVFLVSAAIGLVTIISSLSVAKANVKVIFGILTAVGGFCVKNYLAFQSNLANYQSLITKSAYDKQMDSGRGTLLHLCDEVIQQEVKEVIISFFVLMKHEENVSKEDLDWLCESLIKDEFDLNCNFDVDDAVQKLEKLGIVSKDSWGKYKCVGLTKANDIIGTTTEEVVLKVRGSGPLFTVGQMNFSNSKPKH